MPINLHVTDPASRKFPGRVETPIEHFAQLSAIFPKQFLCSCIGAEARLPPKPRARGRMFSSTPRRRRCCTTRSYSAKLFAELPAAKVLDGSDYPLVLYPRTAHATGLAEFIAGIRPVDLPAEQPAAVLSGNAAGLFGW